MILTTYGTPVYHILLTLAVSTNTQEWQGVLHTL